MISKSKNKGFTLIELLVVISIISLLSSAVMASVSTARKKAQTQKAITDMQTFIKIVSFAQGESGKTLLQMSTDGGASTPQCSNCVTVCTNPNVLKNTPDTNACYVEWTKVLAGVAMNAGNLGDNLSDMNRDPWGSPYLVDQNQGEGSSATCGNRDNFLSAGPDGILSTSDDINLSNSMPLAGSCR